MDYSGKVVLVTGASRGIGQAVALMFAEFGATVAGHFHKGIEAADDTLNRLGAGHRMYRADQGDPDEVRKLVEQVRADYGRIDILVNNAGLYIEHPLMDSSFDQWQRSWNRTLSVNLLGPANMIFWTAKQMIKQGGGRIVNISSRGAFRGEPEAPAYGASKAGLNAMSQSLAKALAPYNIFVCVVAPGWVETDMATPFLSGESGDEIRRQSPLNRVAKPEEVARTVLFLSSDGTDFLTGCIVDVNGASYLRT